MKLSKFVIIPKLRTLGSLVVPFFYTMVLLVVIFYVWTRNVNHQVSTGNFPLYHSLQGTTTYIRHGFDPAQLQEIPVIGSEWAKHEQWPPRVRDSALPGLPERSIISPKRTAAQEFTIIIPIDIGNTAISYLGANPSAMPGIYIAHIAENWEIYFNGVPMLSEIHLNEEGRIISNRYWRHVHFPIDRHLITEGTNILTLRIFGDPRRGSTGLRLINYFDDYRVIKSRNHFIIEMIICGASGFIGFYFLVIFFSAKEKRHRFYLYFSIFSILFCIYTVMRHGTINYLIPNSNIARLFEYFSLMFLVAFLGMFTETIGRGKTTIITKAYLVILFSLAFTQIFIFGHWGEEAISLLNILIFLYFSYVVLHSCLYVYLRYKNKLSSDGTSTGGSSYISLLGFFLPGMILTYILGIYEILDMNIFDTNIKVQFMHGLFIVQIGMAFTLMKEMESAIKKERALNLRNISLEGEIALAKEKLENLQKLKEQQAIEDLTLGDLRLNTVSNRAYLNGADIYLKQKEFLLMLALVKNNDRGINSEKLYETVWEAKINYNKNTLYKHISELRKKLEKADFNYTIGFEQEKGYFLEKLTKK
ncbi:MAG: winged helix-turn-helix domain-containing protein [Treponema sp.]|nr:winged helix-turn-helix domain-containing protein [Treponema sp.]